MSLQGNVGMKENRTTKKTQKGRKMGSNRNPNFEFKSKNSRKPNFEFFFFKMSYF